MQYQVKPTPKLLTPDGWVTHGYMDQETLDAVRVWCNEEIEKSQRDLLQGLVENSPSDTAKAAQNDAYYFIIGWEVLNVLGGMNRAWVDKLTGRKS